MSPAEKSSTTISVVISASAILSACHPELDYNCTADYSSRLLVHCTTGPMTAVNESKS